MFDDGSRKRFDPGFLSHEAAGFLNPQLPAIAPVPPLDPNDPDAADPKEDGSRKSQFIDSGTSASDNGGYFGSISANYFSIPENQGADAIVPIPGNMFGYQLSDSMIPMTITYYTEANEVGGESDGVLAIWDGTNWRGGVDGVRTISFDADDNIVLTKVPGAEDPFAIVPPATLEQWAAKPLGLEIAGDTPEDAGFVRYSADLSDDLSGLNTDFFIYVNDSLLDENGVLKHDSITLRVTATSVEKLGLPGAVGATDPDWMVDGENNAPILASYMPADGTPTPVAINDLATTVVGEEVTISILENDIFNGAMLVDKNGDAPSNVTITSINVSNLPAGANLNTDNEIVITPTATGNITFTYTVTVAIDDGSGSVTSETSNEAVVTIVVNPKAVPDQPVANNDSAVTFIDTPITIDVLANDELNKQSPAATVIVSIELDPANGVAVVNADNRVTYTPNLGYVGTDTAKAIDRFLYTVSVDGVESNTALISVEVAPIPVVDEPVDEPAATSTYSSSSSSGCSVGEKGAPFDPLLPLMTLLALAGLLMRRKAQNV